MNSVQTRPLGGGQLRSQSGLSMRIVLAGIQSDERKTIKDFLHQEVQCEIIGECDTPASALELLRRSSVDILFLDADHPDLRAAGFLQSWSAELARTIIMLASDPCIVTFPAGMNIIDYLAKPASEAVVRLSFAKAKGEIVLQRMYDLQQHIERLSEALKVCRSLAGIADDQNTSNGQNLRQERMVVKENGRLKVVRLDEIGWIEAWHDYVRLHCEGKTHIIHHTISDLETRLDPRQFLRIGRSAIVNVDRIKELEPLNHGDLLVVLKDNTQLNFSRRYRDRLSSAFGYRS
jgi:two-component system LytT family response regulator